MIDMNRLRELTAELGFMPATPDEADIDRHWQLNKNASHSLRAMFVPVDVIFQESTWTPPGAETSRRSRAPTCLPPIAARAGRQ
jgi:hypothetical protein